MTLQYLIHVEGRRPDVWVDVVEPSDVGWRDRARRYADRAIFFIGHPPMSPICRFGWCVRISTPICSSCGNRTVTQ